MLNYYDNKICVVTGGTGFIGRNIVNELLKYKIKEIIIFDRTLKYSWDDQRVKY
jgi:FlaA1/EpsC-like NDP-sugar epimerase